MTAATSHSNCLYCGSPMTDGVAEVRGTFLGFLFFGFSHQHLWFLGKSGDRRKILGSNESSPARRCERCGAVAIPPQKTFADRLEGAKERVSTYVEERSRTPR